MIELMLSVIIITIISLFFTDAFKSVVDIYDSVLKKSGNYYGVNLIVKQMADEVKHSSLIQSQNPAELKLFTFDNSIQAATQPIEITYTFIEPHIYKYHGFYNDTSFFSEKIEAMNFKVESYNDSLVHLELYFNNGNKRDFIFKARN